MKHNKRIASLALIALMLVPDAQAFCGFFVSKAPASLFNHKSEVILVRDGNRTVITMSNDYSGPAGEFAMVVPVPVVLREDQIKVVDRGIFDRLDAYSAPRIVEYYDDNPCQPYRHYEVMEGNFPSMVRSSVADMEDRVAAKHKVVIEARYTIGEYDILLLSAKESTGLETWLRLNGYHIPDAAAEILKPYILTNTKFFVVKVNLDAHRKAGFQYLRPIQISFESEKFMLPIRLGMANAESSQDLIIYAFTKQGRIEPVNYRTAKVPADREIPLFVQGYFGDFYRDVFDRAYHKEQRNAVFIEYAWNVSPMEGVKCDPCVSPPPVFDDFAEAGVNWVSGMNRQSEVFFTRLHVRYTRDKFPQDLLFQVTPNREHFQARYVTRHPAKGDLTCDAGVQYREMLEHRRRLEVQELKALAGWTNPNYEHYITELNPYKKDKYAPVKEDFAPVWSPGSDHSPPTHPMQAGRYILLAMALLALIALQIMAKKQQKFMKPAL